MGFDRVVPDKVYADPVFARVVEPTPRLDSVRVLGELGYGTALCRTIPRRLVDCAHRAGGSEFKLLTGQTITKHDPLSNMELP